MKFFEFFFLEPGWVWRFICLLILIEAFKEFILAVIESLTKCHIRALCSSDDKDSEAAIEIDDSDHPADVDDVRR